MTATDNDLGLQWTPPPPKPKPAPRERRTRNMRIVEQLKARPGEWALVQKGAGSGAGTTWRKYGCEVETRIARGEDGEPLPKNRRDVYVRWPAKPKAAPIRLPQQPAPRLPRSGGQHLKPNGSKVQTPDQIRAAGNLTPAEEYALRQRERLEADRRARGVHPEGL